MREHHTLAAPRPPRQWIGAARRGLRFTASLISITAFVLFVITLSDAVAAWVAQ